MTQSKIGLRKEILICYLSVGPNMSTVISIPYAKEPDSDPGAILFSEELESTMELRGVSNYIVKGNSPKSMLDLSTHQAKGTNYNSELSSSLSVATYHIELHSFDDNHESYSGNDFVVGKISGYTDDAMVQRFVNSIDNYTTSSIEEVKPEQHYSSTLSEFIYEIPSLILYINEDSIDYHSSVAGVVVDFATDYEDRKTS